MLILLFILLAVFPRLSILYLYFATDWFAGLFNTILWPILGFIFMPYTLLWYSAVQHWYGGVWGFWQIAVMIFAVLLDVGGGGKAIGR